ncbi:MAG: MotA/TolQ/ExbB proton channel family protein [Planctomycetaceae bacterium]|nr:MotA/TolQ/ExbB proton channel family protein [Planctomycetaceae bacterium]
MSLDRPSSEMIRSRRFVLLAVLLAALIGVIHRAAPAVAFQNEANEAMPAAEPVKAAPANEPAADVPQQKTFLKWLIDASGPFGACIFVESFIMVALIIMCLMQIRRTVFIPPDFLSEFEGKLTSRDYQGAFNLAKEDESLLARLLVVGMAKLQKGQDEALAAVGELGEDENMAQEHRLSWLALIATTGPMFGLLGTVQGMVQAFDEIASSSTTPKPSELAEGIQLALVTTLEGLIIAIPAMISYSLFRNHLIRLMFDVGRLTEDLLKRMQARPAAPAPVTPAAPA